MSRTRDPENCGPDFYGLRMPGLVKTLRLGKDPARDGDCRSSAAAIRLLKRAQSFNPAD
jgi:hypothetical protein